MKLSIMIKITRTISKQIPFFMRYVILVLIFFISFNADINSGNILIEGGIA